MPKQQHILLNGGTGWQAGHLDHVVLAPCSRDLQLAPAPGALVPLTDAAGTLGGLVLPIGVASDGDGRIYVLDAGPQLIKQFDPCTEEFAILPCVGGAGPAPRQFQNARAIAVSPAGGLYVADTGNQRVQVFALKGLVLRDIWDAGSIRRSGFSAWQPVDVAIAGCGHVYVADYINGAIHVFDRRGCWLSAVPGLVKPLRIALDGEGRIYVVEEGKNSVTVLDADGRRAGEISRSRDAKERFCPLAIAVDRDGNLHISDTLYRRVTVHCREDGGIYTEQRFYNGPAVDLEFDASGNPVVVDPFKKQLATVPIQALFETSGKYYSKGLDSRLYQCVWHRVAIGAAMSPGCRILVDTLTAESDKTMAEVLSLADERWARGQIDSRTGQGEWDCLISSPPGRYLWLRLTLESEGDATPSIHRVRAYYPRQSALQYLPAVFSEDPAGKEFLDRYLSVFDKFWDGFGAQLTNVARYFDPAATPAQSSAGLGKTDFLTWLASWMDLTLDRHWTVEKRRRLLANAHRLYALRGTPEGLRLHLRLYTGAEPTILEHFKLRRWMFGAARLGATSALFGAEIVNRIQLDEHAVVGKSQIIDFNDPLHDPFYATAHKFSVFVPVKGGGTETERQTIDRIVAMAKPAHTEAVAYPLEPRFRIGVQSFIGIDTVIARYPDGILEGKGKLGYDTVLNAGADACPPAARIGRNSRIGSGTVLN